MSSTREHVVGGAGILGAVGWWWRWWMDTRGVFLGIVVPLAFVSVGLSLGVAAIPLTLALGLLFALLWRMGTWGKVLAVCCGLFGAIVITGVLAGTVAVLFVVFALIGNGFMALVIYGFYLLLRGPRMDWHYEARWASPEDTEDMLICAEGRHFGEGVWLALHNEDAIWVTTGFEGRWEMGHFLVCGPSRSGKGLHLISNLLVWRGSAIVNDIKGELYRLTAGRRVEQGQKVRVLNPKGLGDRYDPFLELSYSPEALMSVVMMVMEPEKERQPIFAQRAGYALYAAVLGARKERRATLPYLRELTSEGAAAFVDRLADLDDPEVRRALVDFLGSPPEQLKADAFEGKGFLPDAWGTLTVKLQPLFAEGVLKMCGGSDFEAADLVREPSTLYLMFSEGELRYTAKIFQVIVLALTTGLIRDADLDPDGECVPMLLALDEAGRTPIPGLDDLVSTIAGRGMSALIYVQDLSQLEGAYGRSEAQTIRSNCHTQVYYRPTDYDTAAHISRRCGQTSVVDVRYSGTFGQDASYGQRQRELITPNEVMQMENEEVIVFAGKKPPVMGRRLEWFELFAELDEFVDVPAPEIPELPTPETGGTNTDGASGEQTPRPSGHYEASRNAKEERRKRREGRDVGEEVDGYVEPEL